MSRKNPPEAAGYFHPRTRKTGVKTETRKAIPTTYKISGKRTKVQGNKTAVGNPPGRGLRIGPRIQDSLPALRNPLSSAPKSRGRDQPIYGEKAYSQGKILTNRKGEPLSEYPGSSQTRADEEPSLLTHRKSRREGGNRPQAKENLKAGRKYKKGFLLTRESLLPIW